MLAARTPVGASRIFTAMNSPQEPKYGGVLSGRPGRYFEIQVEMAMILKGSLLADLHAFVYLRVLKMYHCLFICNSCPIAGVSRWRLTGPWRPSWAASLTHGARL